MAPEVSNESAQPRSLPVRPPPKGASVAVLGLIPQPQPEEWLVAYSVAKMGCKGDSPTIAGVCSMGDLPGPQRKRADAWMEQLSHLIGASAH